MVRTRTSPIGDRHESSGVPHSAQFPDPCRAAFAALQHVRLRAFEQRSKDIAFNQRWHLALGYFGVMPLGRFGEYRGILFGSLNPDVPSLEEHLGETRTFLDMVMDQSPQGMELIPGVSRYTFKGNWKLQVENVLDSYHVPFSHASTVSRDGVQFARREGDEKGTKVVAEGGRTADEWKKRRSFTVGRGHGWTSNTALDDGKRASPAFNRYKEALAAKVGAERAQRITFSTPYYNSGIAGGASEVLIPEQPFDIDEVCGALIRRHDQGRFASIVVVAEGAVPVEGGAFTLPDPGVDEFGHVLAELPVNVF